jgi:hypothetical protein
MHLLGIKLGKPIVQRSHRLNRLTSSEEDKNTASRLTMNHLVHRVQKPGSTKQGGPADFDDDVLLTVFDHACGFLIAFAAM